MFGLNEELELAGPVELEIDTEEPVELSGIELVVRPYATFGFHLVSTTPEEAFGLKEETLAVELSLDDELLEALADEPVGTWVTVGGVYGVSTGGLYFGALANRDEKSSFFFPS